MLAELGQAALVRARSVSEDAVLRQVGLASRDGPFTFRFTDAEATLAINITAPSGDVPPDQWETVHGHLTPLLGRPNPGIDLRGLRIGPADVEQAATGHWAGCGIRGLSLMGEGEDLVWYVDCNLPQGVVSGTVDGLTGEFVPSDAPPVFAPPTATPVR